MDMIKALIEALRTKPKGERRYFKEGKLFRTEPSPLFNDRSILQSVNDDVNYTRYRRMTERMGEIPVSYDQWMMGR